MSETPLPESRVVRVVHTVVEFSLYSMTILAAATLIMAQMYISNHDQRARKLSEPVSTAEINEALMTIHARRAAEPLAQNR
jgi:hypothetical protein